LPRGGSQNWNFKQGVFVGTKKWHGARGGGKGGRMKGKN